MHCQISAGVCWLLLLSGTAWASGPATEGRDIVTRWCERNADAKSVFVRFRIYEYDEVFQTAKAGVGECRIDPEGRSYVRSRPQAGVVARKFGPAGNSYASQPMETRQMSWTSTQWSITDVPSPEETEKDILPLENGRFRGYGCGPRDLIPFIPGVESWDILSQFDFRVCRETSDAVFIQATPCGPIPKPGIFLDHVQLMFWRDTYELRAAQIVWPTGSPVTTYVFDPPDVMPPPEADPQPVATEANP